MEYADRVLKQILEKPIGYIFNIEFIKNRSLYISTVKQLILDGYLTTNDVEFSSDYRFLKKLDPDTLNFEKHKEAFKPKLDLYLAMKNQR